MAVKKKLLSGLALLFFILFSASLVSAAAPRYVATTGSDSTDCSVQATPCHTIQYAITQSISGDTINVAAGTYTEQINIDKSLTLSGSGYTTTHIVSPNPSAMTIYDSFGSASPTARYIGHRGANIPVVRIVAPDVTFEGFHVSLNDYAFWDVKGSYVTLLSRGTGILVDHVETISGTPDVFTGIIIRNNKVDGLKAGDKGDAIKALGSATVAISSNLIYVNGESAINAQAVDSPTRALYYPTVTADDNIIYGGSGPRPGNFYFFGIGYWSGATGSADGNTIYNAPNDNGYALNSWTPRAVSFTNNVITTDGGSVGGYGAQLYESPALIFFNNNIEKQSLAGAIWSNPIITITGNTISNCVDGFIVDHQTSGSVTMRNNIITGTGSGHYAVIVGGPADTDSGTVWGDWIGESTVTVDAINNWWGSSSGPYHPTLNPSGTGDKVSDYVIFDPWLHLNLHLLSPTENFASSANHVLLHVSTDSLLVDKMQYSDNGSSFRTLCIKCNSYNQERFFSEGSHTLVVNAKIGSETDTETVDFFVDSIKPRIIKTLPQDGDTIHGSTFYIKYTEKNLVSISLYWKESTDSSYTHVVSLLGCLPGTNKECSIDINLNTYDGKQINYYFEVKDPASTVTSHVNTIKIDSTVPVVTIASPEDTMYSDTKVDLTIGVSETVAKLEYSLDGGKFSKLCTNCNGYDRTKTFFDGKHTLTVNATDYAGNFDLKTVQFTVDSKAPKITKQYPSNNGYTNGTFYVIYTEDNLEKITLYYKGVYEPESSYKPVAPLAECKSGKNKQCNFFADLTAYEGKNINYYFVVENHFGKATSRVYKEVVDTIVPSITINSPSSTPPYTSHRVMLDVAVTPPEDVKLEYSVDGGRFATLCADCSSFKATKTFSKGLHELAIMATDKAGNVKTEFTEFTIS